MNTTPSNQQTETAIITHESWDVPAVFLGADAEARAMAFLLEQTNDYRDEGYTDQEWIDTCLSEGWLLYASEAEGANANWF